jgi:hypothetical protein
MVCCEAAEDMSMHSTSGKSARSSSSASPENTATVHVVEPRPGPH